MPKTKEELNELRQEYESLTNKLKELTEDELEKVTGGGSVFNFMSEETVREEVPIEY